MSARSKGGGRPASSDVQGSGTRGEASEPIGSQLFSSLNQFRGVVSQSREEQQAHAARPLSPKKRKTDENSAIGVQNSDVLQAIKDLLAELLRVDKGHIAPAACSDDRSLRAEMEGIKQEQAHMTQLMNKMMVMLQALQQEVGGPQAPPGNSALPRVPAQTSNRPARPLSVPVTQPSWANITEAGSGSSWTTVTNSKKKLKKHPRDQRRVLFVRNVQSHECDPRDIMFEVNKALAHARAHVTVT